MARLFTHLVEYVPEPIFSDQELVSRARGGDPNAVAELYRLHSPAVFRYCYFRVQDRETAEDLTGEVFVKMVEGLPRYQERGVPITAWLFRIAHDRVVDHHRRWVHRQTDPISDGLETTEAGTEAQALESSEREHVWKLIGTLTEEQRTVIQMRFVEGLSLEDCAHALGKTTGAIKALQHRALRQLAQKLEH
jgi:RNA polymerase sigma-70 factor (ECF subfamily)